MVLEALFQLRIFNSSTFAPKAPPGACQVFGSNGLGTFFGVNPEGIGGAPIDLQNLVGWWPPDGNANGYSGNENNGVLSYVACTGSWTSNYTTL